ncbi:MAG: 2,3-bisphosphoglycerate-independent phosphoglycerate mutase [Planctomycetota bacterium]|nr:MAG: 2,3-bisphosphoglycerate-independent phosphoglycerate mutase [Planctomycetota bacterium]
MSSEHLRLTTNAFHGKRPGPVVVIVMDGVGLGPDYAGNAVRAAHTPTIDALTANHPWLPIAAHGTAVGMPSDADMGNSEVGHNALGAGRVFDQGAKLVQNAIDDGSLFVDEGWKTVTDNVLSKGSTLHFLGLFSDGNVHSHIEHLKSMIAKAKEMGVSKVAVHALLDGRDVGEVTALDYTEPFEAWLAELDPAYGIASGGGRQVITMDRYDANWSMVEMGWKTHVLGEGPLFPSASDAVKALREQHPGTIDQDLPPFVVGRDGAPFATIEDGDSVVFFNFRGDRAIEISKAFTQDTVPFERVRRPQVVYAGMMQYDGDEHIPELFLVKPPVIDRTLSEYLAANGVFQSACSETQKYGHVTYFWNGNKSGYIDKPNEAYVEITSDVVPFEQRPWMKAAEVTDATIKLLREHPHSFCRINFANGDMVGHSGVFEAARISMECVDLCLARLLPVIKQLGGIALVTADHGNADEMYEMDKNGDAKIENGRFKSKTSHTLNPVPFIVYDPHFADEYSIADIAKPGLANVAATVLTLLGHNPPEQYEPSLVQLRS